MTDNNENKSNLDDILGTEPVAEALEENDSIASDDIKDEPVTKQETKQEETKDEEPEKKILVPHGAFHEERERRKELQKKLAEQEERNKVIEERQNKILEALATRNTPQQEEQFVDPLAKLEGEVQTLKKTQAQIDSENKTAFEEQKLVNKYKESVAAYTKDAPDFMDARLYLISDKVKELKALDYSDIEIANEIKLIEKQIVERAYQKEINPAELIHKLAKEKGYKPKEADKKVEDIDKGLKASKSLGSGGKVAGSEDNLSSLSAEDLRDMSDEEFNSLFSKIEKQSKRRA